MTEQTDREKVIDLARKVLALASSPNEHEAARAAEKAQELMFKYNLSLEDLVTKAASEIGERRTGINMLVTWQQRLASAVADSSLCKIFVVEKSRIIGGRYTKKLDREIVFVGRNHDTELAEMILLWLMGELNRLSNQFSESVVEYELTEDDQDKWYDNHPGRFAWSATDAQRAAYEAGPPKIRPATPADRKVARRSWLEGAATTVAHRLREDFEKRRTATVASSALVVHRTADIEAYLDTKNLSKGHSTYSNRRDNEAAYSRGQRDGQSVALRPGQGQRPSGPAQIKDRT